MIHWAKILKSIKLDIMNDPWDLYLDKYYDYNKDLKAEIDLLLNESKALENVSIKNNRLFLKDSKIVIV